MKEEKASICVSCLGERRAALEGEKEGQEQARSVTRREALGYLGKVALCASGGLLWPTGCVKQIAYEARIKGGMAWVPQEKLLSLKDGQSVLSLGAGLGRPIYLRKLPKEGYIALLSRCSHRGCEVDAEPDGYECPCHSARFDLQGARLSGPARRGLVRFPVVVKGDGVWIDLRVQRAAS